MRNTRKSLWSRLYTIGLIAGLGLVVEASLPVSTAMHRLLLLGWVIVIYVAMSAWISRSQLALEYDQTPDLTPEPQIVPEFSDADRIWLQQHPESTLSDDEIVTGDVTQ